MIQRFPWRIAAALCLAWTAAPGATAAEAQVMVVSGTLDEATLRPGEVRSGAIRVRNNGGTVQRAVIRQADYRFFADGRSLYEAPGAHPRSNAGWVGLGAGTVTLAPGEEASIPFEVRVPADASLTGTYWSVVLVETEVPAAPAARRGMGITPVIRYAVQVATHVGSDAGARLAFQAPRVESPAPATRRLTVEVANTGERAERVELRLDLYDAQGNSTRKLRAQRGLVYPGTSIAQAFDLGELGPGVYRALVVADAGGDELFGAEYTIRP
jgi:hypothetical protein